MISVHSTSLSTDSFACNSSRRRSIDVNKENTAERKKAYKILINRACYEPHETTGPDQWIMQREARTERRRRPVPTKYLTFTHGLLWALPFIRTCSKLKRLYRIEYNRFKRVVHWFCEWHLSYWQIIKKVTY